MNSFECYIDEMYIMLFVFMTYEGCKHLKADGIKHRCCCDPCKV